MIKTGMGEVTAGNAQIAKGNAENSSSMCGCDGVPDITAGTAQVSQGHIQEAMGAMMVAAGIADAGTAGGRSSDIAPTDAGSTIPTLGNGNGFQTGGTGMPAGLQDTLNSGIQAAKAAGIDPTNPDSVASAAQNAGLDGSGDGGLSAGLDKLSPDQQAAIAAEKDKLMTQFHVSGVGTEGGGGGGGGKVAKGNGGDDLAGLLDGLGKGSGGSRDPASVAGLSKMFNGDSIGVAGDNIFKKVSRRYQAKIQQKKFLPN